MEDKRNFLSKSKKYIFALIVIFLIAVSNYLLYKSQLKDEIVPGLLEDTERTERGNSEKNTKSYVNVDWQLFEKTKISSENGFVVFADELLKLDEKNIKIKGTLYLTESGIKNNQIFSCVLMPTRAYGICPSCAYQHETTIYIDCTDNPLKLPEIGHYKAIITGVLKLEDENPLDCLYTIINAHIIIYELRNKNWIEVGDNERDKKQE